MDKNILQLREYHITRGRNKSSAPIYPITKAECIIGEIGGNGVTEVASLPEPGENGKIYYNTTDRKYYVYDTESSAYNAIAKETPEKPGLPIATDIESDDSTTTVGETAYGLLPNTFYNLNDLINSIGMETTHIYLIDATHDDDSFTRQYIWRLTVPGTDGESVTILSGFSLDIEEDDLAIPEASKDILDDLEPNHTYEFNVLEGVLFVADVTNAST